MAFVTEPHVPWALDGVVEGPNPQSGKLHYINGPDLPSQCEYSCASFDHRGSGDRLRGAVGGALEIQRSPYATYQDVAQAQPVPFSHQHHDGGDGIDCRYCHTSVENSSFAGIPPTKTCMNCHSQIWTDAPMLEPVRESYRTGKSLVWTRVDYLPDFVYFNHSIHVDKGVGCASCHGPVDKMPLMFEANSLQMEWCLNCHRAPEKFLRPRDQVFNMNYRAAQHR